MRVRSSTSALALSIFLGATSLSVTSCATSGATTKPDGDVEQPLEPDPSNAVMATLRLVNARLGCGVPALRFSRGDEVLAVLGPDDHVELAVPTGHYIISVHDGRGLLDHAIDVGPEGATLSPGCFGDPFRSGGLQPLTLIGPDAACAIPSVRARAGGLLVELGVGEHQTLYLPRAVHVVRILGEGKRGRDTTVDLTAGGAELQLVTCTESAIGRP